MKNDKLLTFLWSSLLSFSLSLSATMWLVTAFDLGVDISLLTVFCLLASVLCSFCYCLPLGAAPPILGILSLLQMWQNGALADGVEAILNRLSRQYDNAYHWGIIRWGLRTADDMEPTIVTALCILAAITIVFTTWAVCRKKSSFYPVLSVLYVAACFVVNDTVPGVPWIFLLLTTAILLLMTGPVRRQNPKAGNRLCMVLMPFVLILLFVVFGLIPQKTYDLQENAKLMTEKLLGTDPMQYLMGEMDGNNDYDQHVDLTTVGYRTAPEAKVMEVTAPYSGVLYLRSSAMDTYDGESWTYSGDPDLPWPSAGLANIGEVTVKTRFALQMLYVPYYSTYSSLSGMASGVPNEKNLREYSFTCRRLPDNVTPSMLAAASSNFTDWDINAGSYIHLTDEVKIWATALALKITDGATTTTEKAERIASYVRNSATYSLETARMPSKEEDFARWFLEQSETGYCVHFATATAVLLQALDIPARYVTGYMTTVEALQVTEVKSKEAHAWVEYFLPGFGWVLLESTPAAARPEAIPPAETLPSAPQESEAATMPTESQATQIQPTTPKPTVRPTKPADWEENPEIPTTALLCVVVAAVVMGLLFLQRFLRLSSRKKKLAAAPMNEKALLCWQLCEDLAALLQAQPPKELLELAEKAKFSHHTLTQEELEQFHTFRENAVRALKKRNLFLQIYYRLILAKY